MISGSSEDRYYRRLGMKPLTVLDKDQSDPAGPGGSVLSVLLRRSCAESRLKGSLFSSTGAPFSVRWSEIRQLQLRLLSV